MSAETITLNALSEESGIERRELKKALLREAVPFTKQGKRCLWNADKARAVAKAHLDRRAKRQASTPGGVSPMTRYYTAKAEQVELENEQKKRELDREWVKVSDVDDLLRLLTDALDRFPGKWRSEHGLPASVVTAIQRDLDGARQDAAAKLRK